MAEGNNGMLVVGLLGLFALLAFFLSRPSVATVTTMRADVVSLERDKEGRLIGMVSSSR